MMKVVALTSRRLRSRNRARNFTRAPIFSKCFFKSAFSNFSSLSSINILIFLCCCKSHSLLDNTVGTAVAATERKDLQSCTNHGIRRYDFLIPEVIVSTFTIITLCFQAALLKTSARIHTDRDLFCRASRPVPCCHARCELRVSRGSRTGIPFYVCSWVQNNTLPLSCFHRFMAHLPFAYIKLNNLWWPEWDSNPHAFAQRSELCVPACYTIRPLAVCGDYGRGAGIRTRNIHWA